MAPEIDFLASDDEEHGAHIAVPTAALPAPASAAAGADDDAAFIAAATQRHNIKAGTQVAKKATKKSANTASGVVSGGGSFQSMGLHPSLLRSLLLRGYTTPTPIQRRAIPAILAQPPQDVVGMARTGSGKTLSYMVPLIQRLNGRHSTSFGIKSLILVPSRELAVQIVRVGKDIARGWRDDNAEAIRWALVVGGEGMDEQFALMSNNPDVVIATPGRLLHLIVEMNMDLRTVEYVVFDEADRLFEMGFAEQLEELLRRLPPTRQTLLFSATLPKSLVEFARAGLEANPRLIRLDADSKISPELRMAFFSVKPTEKEASLLLLLRLVIGVPTGEQEATVQHKGQADMRPYQTIIFCATKHHVEYLLLLLTTVGYACAHIYSSLDQAARGSQMALFRSGRASLLIVTDLAARGIDLPVLEHVINYDFAPQPRLFVHRVGRTARAGRSGWAWSLVTPVELPYLCDLQLFLGRPLVSAHRATGEELLDLNGALVIGTLPREAVDEEVEAVDNMMHASSNVAANYDALRGVVKRAHSMYVRSQAKPSQESFRRAKDMSKDAERLAITGAEAAWALAGGPLEEEGVHDVVRRPSAYGLGGKAAPKPHDDSLAAARASLLAKVNSFRPGETVFEIGQRGQKQPLSRLMQDRRRTLATKQIRARSIEESKRAAASEVPAVPTVGSADNADEAEIASVFNTGSFKDPTFYMSYEQQGASAERGYSLGRSFADEAKGATMDVAGDDVGPGGHVTRIGSQRWDPKKKRFIKGDGAGANNEKMIRTESGLRLPASFRSGRYDQWRKEQRVQLPRAGEQERALPTSVQRQAESAGRTGRFVHKQSKAPKPLDPKRSDYKKKLKQHASKGSSNARSELKTATDIHKARALKEKRRAKNARPSHKRH
ncbi:RNA helicase [Malassezia cuniculi]|uniref:RNA helicase n=1 Tax=Malassezia cuniculi TaxID=948313 RepID=A0AAF0EWY5_9BASI|nr:RNA helicase [Malassezia cuniculi]